MEEGGTARHDAVSAKRKNAPPERANALPPSSSVAQQPSSLGMA